MSIPKVLVIGLDGATWDLIKPWADEGKLPVFKNLMENGVWGELESTTPPFTIPAWNSLTSGKNPGKLGFSVFMIKDGYDFRPYFTVAKKERHIWDILSENGRRVCIVNVPSIHSAYRINGYMVAGWLYRAEKTLTYPRELKGELDKVSNGYEVDLFEVDLNTAKVVRAPSTNREYLKKTNDLLEKHFRTFEYLLKESEWDFGLVLFVAPDRIQHRFWDKKELVLEIYRKIDRHLKALLETVNENTVVILVSDHGFGSGKRTFNVNEWLIKEGYLRLRKRNRNGNRSNKTLQITGFFRRLKLLPIARWLLNLLPSKISKSLIAKLGHFTFEHFDINDIEWSKTKAFGYGVFGTIYLNVKGREPEGIIDPEDYESARNDIIHRLSLLKEPKTGVPLEVFKREEIYEGEYLERMPDLIIKLNNNIQSINPTVGSNKTFIKTEGGDHRVNGIFVAHGPSIRGGVKIEGAKICDISPTILRIFGLPVPTDMDGRVLEEIFEEGSELARREMTYQEAEAKDEKQRIKERTKELKDLGRI